MSETVTQPAQEDAEAQAMASARAGYASRAGKRAAAAAAPVAPAAVEAPAEPPLAEAAPAPEQEPSKEPEAGATELNLSAAPATPPIDPAPNPLLPHLEDLKAQMREMKDKGVDAKTISELAGVVGDINRQVKALAAAKKEDAPVAESRLAAALKRAKEKADEYPELGQPMLEALQELAAEITTKAEPAPAPEAKPTAAAPASAAPLSDLAAQLKLEQKAKADLLEIHADFYEVRKSDGFQKWFASKTPEYRTKVTSSWNPIVVAEPVTAYKAHLEQQRLAEQRKQEEAKRKQDRLAAAEQPSGLQQGGAPTQPTDTELARRGYQRYAGKRL